MDLLQIEWLQSGTIYQKNLKKRMGKHAESIFKNEIEKIALLKYEKCRTEYTEILMENCTSIREWLLITGWNHKSEYL